MYAAGWYDHVRGLSEILYAISCRDSKGREIDVEAAFDRWQAMALNIRDKEHTVYLIGNGASASMASHLAADLAKNVRLHTEVFSDVSLITAVSNDIGYDRVFAEPLSTRARHGDMLVAISSSGRSPNILSAVSVGKEHGMDMVTLSAMDEDNPLRSTGSLNIYVRTRTYGDAESAHSVILHHWMDMVEASDQKG